MLPHIDKTIHPHLPKRDRFTLVGFIWANESPSKAARLSRGSFGWAALDRQNAKPYLPSSCCRLSCSQRRDRLLAIRAGLSGSGTAVGMGSST